jgi:hypothetical protein
VGYQPQITKPWMGRKKRFNTGFLTPLAGLDFFDGQTHGFTVGYWLAHPLVLTQRTDFEDTTLLPLFASVPRFSFRTPPLHGQRTR